MSLCIYYHRRNYTELYVGFLVVIMIVVGIPTFIGLIEFFLNFKFCQKYDEEADAMLGGMTFCEAIFFILTCGKSMRAKQFIADEYIVKYQILEEEYQRELERQAMIALKQLK